ncbi:MAG: hypothetical protein C0404_11490 [Verrucomicrobia bacterium]|nr:hypothetical protein [Verrucomicrobiota bacterium]
MKLLKKIRVIPETIGVCIAMVVIPVLPRRAVLALAAMLGWLGYKLSSKLRAVALANLDLAFKDSMTAEQKKIAAIGSFRLFALVLLDVFWFGWRTRGRVRKYVRFDGSFDHFFRTSPLVAVTAHIGNWEAMGLAAALHGEPPLSVAMPLKNRFADRILNRMRTGTGQQIVERQGAVRTLLKGLHGNARVALLLDQNTLPEDGGRYVDLFGVPAPISRAGVTLAMRTGAGTVFTYCLADGQGGYTAFSTEPRYWRNEESEDMAMQELARTLENVIRKHPDQWLWSYKRWKFIPAGHDGKGFPFYARLAVTADVETARGRAQEG